MNKEEEEEGVSRRSTAKQTDGHCLKRAIDREGMPEIMPAKVVIESIRPRLLDLKDASKYCGLSESRLREYVTAGKLQSVVLPHPFKNGRDTRKTLIELKVLDKFIEKYSEKESNGRMNQERFEKRSRE